MTRGTEGPGTAVWKIEMALRYYGNAEYEAGVQQGTDEHKRYLSEATRQMEYVQGLIHELAYGTKREWVGPQPELPLGAI